MLSSLLAGCLLLTGTSLAPGATKAAPKTNAGRWGAASTGAKGSSTQPTAPTKKKSLLTHWVQKAVGLK